MWGGPQGFSEGLIGLEGAFIGFLIGTTCTSADPAPSRGSLGARLLLGLRPRWVALDQEKQARRVKWNLFHCLFKISWHKPPWPNGQGIGLLIRRLWARVPQGAIALLEAEEFFFFKIKLMISLTRHPAPSRGSLGARLLLGLRPCWEALDQEKQARRVRWK